MNGGMKTSPPINTDDTERGEDRMIARIGKEGSMREHAEKFYLHREFGLQSAPPSAKNQMPSRTPKPRFRRQHVRGMPERVESYCMRCGQFVAASDKPGYLKIAEKAHICPKSGLKK